MTATVMGDEVVVHFMDFTTMKRLQLELSDKVAELERSNQNLEEFTYAASHDLKEPIRKVHFFADRIKQQLGSILNEEQHRLFDRMENAAQRMSTLIEDLLIYSQVSRGVSHLEQVDLNRKVKNVLEDLELEVAQKHAKITVDLLPTITGHKRQIQQLFQNLISNALKYSKPDVPPEIHISSRLIHGRDIAQQLKSTEADKAYYLIEIRDNGIGFDQTDAERIFNVFTRLHGNAQYRGTGVGLAIVKKAVENHHGFIWASSTPGEGAR
jgi:light-regulated signal transduction histidine kinase (bacteriophytochrome)